MAEQMKIVLEVPNAPAHTYDVVIADNALESAAAFIAKTYPDKNVGVITDTNVMKRYGAELRALLKKHGVPRGEFVAIAPGEQSKTLKTVEKITGHFFKKGFLRDSVFVALGGGVIGDITGFVAAIFARGVPFVQIPTTVVSQIDSSVGGKTGVDTAYGKNLLGAFHQPGVAFIGVGLLKTLTDDEYLYGFAEIVKHALIKDRGMFEELEKNIHRIRARETEFLINLVSKNIEIKKAVVEADPTENGFRQILNFGHTIGHAIEEATRYRIVHGAAVAAGLFYESSISVKEGKLSETEYERIRAFLISLGILNPSGYGIKPETIVKFTERDKKNTRGKAHYVLLKKIGAVYSEDNAYSFPVNDKHVLAALRASIAAE